MKRLKQALMIFLTFSMITGGLYPLLMTVIGQTVFPLKANGSLVKKNERILGSLLIGQNFTTDRYFHGRPSAVNYASGNSGASNYGPLNSKYISEVMQRADQFRKQNQLPPDAQLPPEMIFASGSGLDPHISVKGALLQIKRIAKSRALGETEIMKLVENNSERQYFGLGGAAWVNVLKLNILLDEMGVNR